MEMFREHKLGFSWWMNGDCGEVNGDLFRAINRDALEHKRRFSGR